MEAACNYATSRPWLYRLPCHHGHKIRDSLDFQSLFFKILDVCNFISLNFGRISGRSRYYVAIQCYAEGKIVEGAGTPFVFGLNRFSKREAVFAMFVLV